MEMKGIAEEGEVAKLEVEAKKLEIEAKKLVPEQFYRWIKIFSKK